MMFGKINLTSDLIKQNWNFYLILFQNDNETFYIQKDAIVFQRKISIYDFISKQLRNNIVVTLQSR